MTGSFSLLTLNCFGLWLPKTGRRLQALAGELERRADDVVCLQEIQLHRYRRILTEACASYPYRQHEPYVHCPKGGLLTLSRLPVESGAFVPYRERGLWYTPMLLDRLFFKGMLVTRLRRDGLPLIVVNTHLLANFAGDWGRRGMYARVEEGQLRQLAETVRSLPRDWLVIVAGDFNVPRGSRLYEEFLGHSGLTDPLAGDPRPTLRLPPGTPARFSLAIDYALVRLPERGAFTVQAGYCFTEKPRSMGYLSDHVGIELKIVMGGACDDLPDLARAPGSLPPSTTPLLPNPSRPFTKIRGLTFPAWPVTIPGGPCYDSAIHTRRR